MGNSSKKVNIPPAINVANENYKMLEIFYEDLKNLLNVEKYNFLVSNVELKILNTKIDSGNNENEFFLIFSKNIKNLFNYYRNLRKDLNSTIPGLKLILEELKSKEIINVNYDSALVEQNICPFDHFVKITEKCPKYLTPESLEKLDANPDLFKNCVKLFEIFTINDKKISKLKNNLKFFQKR
jgi:hypothetical protein